jgi:hypothetical protein
MKEKLLCCMFFSARSYALEPELMNLEEVVEASLKFL